LNNLLERKKGCRSIYVRDEPTQNDTVVIMPLTFIVFMVRGNDELNPNSGIQQNFGNKPKKSTLKFFLFAFVKFLDESP